MILRSGQRADRHLLGRGAVVALGLVTALQGLEEMRERQMGADLRVDGAVAIARAHEVSDAFIGLTIVAIGTSAPELATTIVATYRDDRDVAIGNLIGSSIYNILVILGVTMVVAPDGVEVGGDVLWVDLPLGVIVAALCLPVFRSGQMVSRTEGVVAVAAYVAYLATLVTLRT